jgi:hypothetical protein
MEDNNLIISEISIFKATFGGDNTSLQNKFKDFLNECFFTNFTIDKNKIIDENIVKNYFSEFNLDEKKISNITNITKSYKDYLDGDIRNIDILLSTLNLEPKVQSKFYNIALDEVIRINNIKLDFLNDKKIPKALINNSNERKELIKSSLTELFNKEASETIKQNYVKDIIPLIADIISSRSHEVIINACDNFLNKIRLHLKPQENTTIIEFALHHPAVTYEKTTKEFPIYLN